MQIKTAITEMLRHRKHREHRKKMWGSREFWFTLIDADKRADNADGILGTTDCTEMINHRRTLKTLRKRIMVTRIVQMERINADEKSCAHRKNGRMFKQIDADGKSSSEKWAMSDTSRMEMPNCLWNRWNAGFSRLVRLNLFSLAKGFSADCVDYLADYLIVCTTTSNAGFSR